MKHVFIIGAGASREAGGPLMMDFFDRAEQIRKRTDIDKAAFDLVFRAIEELQVVHSKAALDINNIESVMTAFEMAALFGRLGSLAPGEVRGLRDAITTLVAQTVDELVCFNVVPQSTGVQPWGVQPWGVHSALCNAVNDLLRSGEQVSILSYNYDLGADFAIDVLDRPIDYGLSNAPMGPTHIPLLKLHGSLAWRTPKAPEDMTITAIPVRQLGRTIAEHIGTTQGRVPIRIRQYLPGGPVIVPPTWTKGPFYESIKQVWLRAADELKEAENIYVVGYSLPFSDEFFRLLYALGTAGATRIKRFWVFDPNGAVEERFRRLLGQAVEDRFRFYQDIASQGFRKLTTTLMDEGVVRMPV
jgi:hypothetical protein